MIFLIMFLSFLWKLTYLILNSLSKEGVVKFINQNFFLNQVAKEFKKNKTNFNKWYLIQ